MRTTLCPLLGYTLAEGSLANARFAYEQDGLELLPDIRLPLFESLLLKEPVY